MSENGEIYTACNKFHTAAGTDGMDKFHLCFYALSLPALFQNNKAKDTIDKRVFSYSQRKWFGDYNKL